MTGLHCEMGTEWECHVTLLNGLPGVGRGGRMAAITKAYSGSQTRYKTGTGPPSLPWNGQEEAAAALVLTEWRDYF